MGVKTKFLYFVKQVSRAVKEEKITKVIVPTDKDKILAGKNAIIVGGTGGIGLAIADSLRNSGCNVIITGRNQEKAEAAAKKMGGENIRGAALDISNIDQIRTRIPEIANMFDNSSIDILVNAAGVISTVDFLDVTEEQWDTLMDANLKGLFFASQVVSKHMIEKGIKGHILNISSASGLRPAWKPYQISKWAVNGFTKGLADTLLPYGIICNGIAPGPVATAMMKKEGDESLYNPTNPSGRCAASEEIANLALFLVSSMGDLVVGETYVISGGGGTISYHK